MNGLEVVEEESSDSEEIKENLEQLHLIRADQSNKGRERASSG